MHGAYTLPHAGRITEWNLGVLMAGANDTTIWMWNGKTGACMNVFSGGHSAPVTCGMFTSDGNFLSY